MHLGPVLRLRCGQADLSGLFLTSNSDRFRKCQVPWANHCSTGVPAQLFCTASHSSCGGEPPRTTWFTTTGGTTYDNDNLDDAIFRSFLRFFRSFVRFFVRSKIFQKIGRVAAMILVQKSSKSELSSRFFGR